MKQVRDVIWYESDNLFNPVIDCRLWEIYPKFKSITPHQLSKIIRFDIHRYFNR